MAKAKVQLSDGTTVTIEGTPDEVAAMLRRLSPAGSTSESYRKKGPRQAQRRGSASVGSGSRSTRSPTKGPVDYIRELLDDDFFKTKRGLGEVRSKLEERAHIYPNTTISPVLFRMVRNRELRRIREDGKWKYVNA
jgi:hypothetical protein